jgi:Fe-S-cluster containining protein
MGGECCRHLDQNPVALYGKDILRLYEATGLRDIFFLQKREQKTLIDVWVKFDDDEGVIFLKHTDDEDKACIFLKDNLCSVHEHRPDICRNYPFNYVMNIIDKGGKRQYRIDFILNSRCEGLDTGDEVDMDALVIQFWKHFNDSMEA